MRSGFVRCVAVLVALHLGLALAQAADDPPPPELKINQHSVTAATSAGISKETLDAVTKAILEYGVSWDLGDEKRHRDAITGTPAMVEMAVAAMHTEQAENAANQLARETLPDRPIQPGTTHPSRREPYPRTNYHRGVLGELVTIKGDDQRLTITRPSLNRPTYVLEKTPQGWRVVITEDELRGVSPDKAAAFIKEQGQAYAQLKQQLERGEFKSWKDYAAATSAIRKKFREQLKAATPATAPAAR